MQKVMFLCSPDDSSMCLNTFYSILFTLFTRATVICIPTPIPPIPKGGKMIIFLPFPKFKGPELDNYGVTRSRQLYFKPLRYNKQVWLGNHGAIGT